MDDSGDTAPNTVQLSSNRITGLGLGGDDPNKGIEYYNIETLNIEYGTGGSNIFNVRGTTATTNIIGLDTDDYIFVSSDANVTAATLAGFDFLTGNLDGILGTLNIDGRGGRNQLFISDEASTVGDGNVVITDRNLPGSDPGLAPDREITITDLAPAPISYRATGGGNFARGITIWTGSGNDTITIDGTLTRNEQDAAGDPLRIVTTLNTGLGDDTVTVNLTAGQDGFFVLNTRGHDNSAPNASDRDTVDASLSTLSLVIFGGQDRDTIVGGQAGDIIFGDRGRVEYTNEFGHVVAVLGNGGPGDRTDGKVRTPARVYTVDVAVGGNDTIDGSTVGNGTVADEDILFGGRNDDVAVGETGPETLRGGEDDDLIFGDFGVVILIGGVVTSITSTDTRSGGGDVLAGGAGDDVALGGFGKDQVAGAAGRDLLIGDSGAVTLVAGLPTNIATTEPSAGDNDTLSGGTEDDILLGGIGADILTGVGGDDLLLGDAGRIQLTAGQPTSATTTDATLGGNDSLTGGDGDDTLIGGFGADTLNGGAGGDVLLGDLGVVIVGGGTVPSASSTDPTLGGDDAIIGGVGNDVAIGGPGRDTIAGDAGHDVLIGDSATVQMPSGQVSTVATTNPTLGGDDTIAGGADNDTILGGAGNDTLTGGTGRDSILGDHGTVAFRGTFSATFNPALLTSTDPTLGGNDTIDGNEGDDALIGGTNNDRIDGGTGADLIFGDHVRLDLATLPKASYTSTFIDAGSGGGNDVIHGDADNDTVFGGQGDDTLYGDYGNAALNGGHSVSGGASGFDSVLGGYGSNAPDHDFGDGVPALSHPAFTFQYTADFSTVIPARFAPVAGSWSLSGGRYQGTAVGSPAAAPFSLAYVRSTYVELQAIVNVQGTSAGLIFDYRSASDYKFAAISATTGQVVVGRRTSQGLVNDSTVTRTLRKSQDYTFAVILNRNTASDYLNGQLALTYTFADLATDGQVGLLSVGGTSTFDNVVIRGDDPSAATGLSLTASAAPPAGVGAVAPLSADDLRQIGAAAIRRWLAIRPDAAALLAGVTFELADLPGAALGLAVGDTVLIDPTAAGFGWFIDATPLDDSGLPPHSAREPSTKVTLHLSLHEATPRQVASVDITQPETLPVPRL